MYVRVYHEIADPVRYGRSITPRDARHVREVLGRAAKAHVPEGSRWYFIRQAHGSLISLKVMSECGLTITLE